MTALWWSLPSGPERERLKRESAPPPKLLFIPTRFRQAGSAKRHANYWESARGIRHYFSTRAEGRVALSLAKCGWAPLADVFSVEEPLNSR